MALVTLRSYRDLIDADLAKMRLDDAGIPSFVADQYVTAMQWLYSGAIGGVKLQVDEADLALAREVLREDRSGDLLGIAESQTPPTDGDRCPSCGSARVGLSSVQRRAAAISLATALPFVAWRHRWVCAACGHTWRRRRRPREVESPETLEAEQRVYEPRSYAPLRGLFAMLVGLLILCYVELRIRSAR